ncbi:MAG: DUF4268 domain-containing protein [Chloroflexota bacterium]|nr:DUF4268 domain-containing protein [Chloroflexota bacterium]
MATADLGQLEEVVVRKAWSDEAQDFTPWLAEHLDLLGDAIEANLELEDIEVQVGGFSLDILAMSERGLVAIENQLEQANHSHLGQLITYASGLNANILVWVATGFRQAHLDAVDWLNALGASTVNVFAVQVRVVKIDESRMAPDFRALASPKGWSQKPGPLGETTGMSVEERELRYRFFAQLTANALERSITPLWAGPAAQSKSFICLEKGCGLVYWVDLLRRGLVTVKLYIDMGSVERNHSVFDGLFDNQSEIESCLGFEPEWFPPDPNGPKRRKTGRVMVQRSASIDDSSQQTQETLEWILHVLEKFQEVLEPRLRAIRDELNPEEAASVEEDLTRDGVD